MAPEGSGGPLGFDDDPEDDARRARTARREAAPIAGERATTGQRGPRPPRRLLVGAARYGWFVGVVGVLLVALIVLNTFRSEEGPGSRGITSGGAAPPFAAPLALSPLAGAESNDVNVALERGQGDAGAVPACSVRQPDVLNICALYERGPVVLAFFATRSSECIEQLDRLDAAARRHPEVAFAAVSIRGDLADVRRIVRDRGWTFPVGYDDDGILANAYGVAVCPQITFLEQGGRVQDTSLGAIDDRALERRVRRLER